MKLRDALAALALGAFADVTPAEAETKQLAKAQSWEAFGGTTANGRGVCGISAEPGGRYFGVKVFAGNDRFTIQMGTPEWKQLPPDQKITLHMRFDANAEWNAPGTSFRFEDGDMGLQVFVNRSEMDAFSSEFRFQQQARDALRRRPPAALDPGPRGHRPREQRLPDLPAHAQVDLRPVVQVFVQAITSS